MFTNAFSFEGRIRRSELFVSLIVTNICLFISALIGFMVGIPFGIVIFGFAYLAAQWFVITQSAKRCHDLGKSGWWQLIPFYVFWMLFADGQPFENEYGSDPKGRSTSPYQPPPNPFDPNSNILDTNI